MIRPEVTSQTERDEVRRAAVRLDVVDMVHMQGLFPASATAQLTNTCVALEHVKANSRKFGGVFGHFRGCVRSAQRVVPHFAFLAARSPLEKSGGRFVVTPIHLDSANTTPLGGKHFFRSAWFRRPGAHAIAVATLAKGGNSLVLSACHQLTASGALLRAGWFASPVTNGGASTCDATKLSLAKLAGTVTSTPLEHASAIRASLWRRFDPGTRSHARNAAEAFSRECRRELIALSREFDTAIQTCLHNQIIPNTRINAGGLV